MKQLGRFCIALATFEHKFSLTESLFQVSFKSWDEKNGSNLTLRNLQKIQIANAIRLMIEGFTEQKTYDLYKLGLQDISGFMH